MSTITAFQSRHAGGTIVVCGCGESLNDLGDPGRYLTIGVNDVGRLFDPRYLVVVNPRSQFAPGRFRHVEESRAEAVFSQLALEIPHPEVVRFQLGRYGGTSIDDSGDLHYTANSPYVAVCLAAYMGASRIGVIGVDFTDHHFFAATGVHALTRRLPEIDAEFGRLRTALLRRGIDLVNLSRVSRLTSLPRRPTSELAVEPRRAGAATGVRVVSYATTPVAGVAPILARCITARTSARARCVWATRSYSNGVVFDGDIEWTERAEEAVHELETADVVVVHNGKVDARHERLLANRRVITMAHNYMWNVDRRFVERGGPGVVVGQYQATLPEFRGWGVVPNPIPLWEPAFCPECKPDVVTIAYTPSGRHERYSPGHRLHWHGKGYDTTVQILQRLRRLYNVQLAMVESRQVSHAESLAMKRRAHIVIDECVTGSYHRNSLEGLAAGCVVVNGVGLIPGVAEALQRCAPHSEELPFEFSSLGELERTLITLIQRGSAALAEAGRHNRAWLERHWDFADQWERCWLPAVDAAATRREHVSLPCPVPRTAHTLTAPVIRSRRGPPDAVSAVIPHAGAERLPQLLTTLASLRQRPGVAEIVLVELGSARLAGPAAERWADKYVFVTHDGPFERARALNAGTAAADHDLVLWHDNDLLSEPDFIRHAVAELRARGLDYLIPYNEVRYLSPAHSHEVMRGAAAPSDHAPVNVMWSRRPPRCSGGVGLVSRSFLDRHGGLIEGFRGWGGEDNAWTHKVGRLGRMAPTQRDDQRVYHLYHAGSGGYPEEHSSAHAHYAENLDVLRRVTQTTDAHALSTFSRSASHEDSSEITFVPSRSTRAERAMPGHATPVWSYWEGPCPAWIRACRRTLTRHAPGLRLLTWQDFDRLRDRDRDLDLRRLSPAHRADFIRAFLLARYGGLWVDADCIVMQSLSPIVDAVQTSDFLAHRERSGLISNGFIGARESSPLAAAFYARVRNALRSGRSPGWTTFGSEPLTALLEADDAAWHELPCAQIQPIGWDTPHVFTVLGHDRQHESGFDANAVCYMLSNTQIRRIAGAEALVDPRAFFSFLIRRSLGGDGRSGVDYEEIFGAMTEQYRRYGDESISGPGSTLARTARLRERLPILLQQLEVRALLDAPCGDVNWMHHVDLGVDRYIGVDVQGEVIARNTDRHAAPSRQFLRLDITDDPLPAADAVLCRDCLVHMPFADVFRSLRNFRRTGAQWLVTTTFTDRRPNVEAPPGAWRPLDLTGAPFAFPPPHLTIVEDCDEAGGAYTDKALGVWHFDNLPLSE